MTPALFVVILLLVPAAVVVVVVVVAWRVGPVLVARYDLAALRPAPATGAPAPLRPLPPKAWQALLAWCFDGAGDGRGPLWRPWVPPRVDQPFTVAWLADAADGPAPALAEAFSRHIDGSDQLAALGSRAAGIALRLRVKLHDAMWWRARQPSDPWDSGYLVNEPAALQALQAFRPRRATLLVASGLPAPALRARLAVLRAGSATYRHPVRLLIVGGEEQPAELDAGGVRLIQLAETGR